MDTKMAELSDYFNHQRPSLDKIARLMTRGDALTVLQMSQETGLTGGSVRSAIKFFYNQKLVYIDSWVREKRIRSYAMPVYRMGSQPDANRPMASKLSYEQRERKKETQSLYRLAKKEAREVKRNETDWNSIMYGFVRGVTNDTRSESEKQS